MFQLGLPQTPAQVRGVFVTQLVNDLLFSLPGLDQREGAAVAKLFKEASRRNVEYLTKGPYQGLSIDVPSVAQGVSVITQLGGERVPILTTELAAKRRSLHLY